MSSRVGDLLPDTDNVLRYGGARVLDKGRPTSAAFMRKLNEDALSVNWLECFEPPQSNQIQKIRDHRGIHYGATAMLLLLNVGKTCSHIEHETRTRLAIKFRSDPRPAFDQWPDDPSHSTIEGLPIEEEQAHFVGALLCECVEGIFPAIP
jgi:hypothetical protein